MGDVGGDDGEQSGYRRDELPPLRALATNVRVTLGERFTPFALRFHEDLSGGFEGVHTSHDAMALLTDRSFPGWAVNVGAEL
jgi:hypothetical protein